MRNAIVTGGNGFIGSSLIERLVSMNWEVHALVNENHQRLDAILPRACIHVLQNSVESAADIVARVQPDTIFHMAAVYAEPVSARCVLSMIEGNLTLGACLLFAATRCKKRPAFVNTGTYWQFDENFGYSPNTLYAATKHAFQDLLQFYRKTLGIAALTLILYDTFGEADTRAKLWNRLTSAPPGSSIALSAGEQTIHLVHIDDIVQAFVRAAELLHSGEPIGSIYSASSQNPATLRNLADSLNATAQLGLDLKWGELPYWEGQVFQPWVGEVLPGWRARIAVLPALVRIAHRRASSGFGLEDKATASLDAE